MRRVRWMRLAYRGVGQIFARGGYQPDAAPGEQRDTQFLHDQVASEAAGVLDDDDGLRHCLPCGRGRVRSPRGPRAAAASHSSLHGYPRLSRSRRDAGSPYTRTTA